MSCGQHANSHVKIVGNTFHDWRGMGVAVRNARNVVIRDNLFLPPVQDTVLRETFAADPAMSGGGAGRYAGVFLDSVSGARVSGNRFVGLPAGDRPLVRGDEVHGVVASDNPSGELDRRNLDAVLSFSEWFGASIANSAPTHSAWDGAQLHGATHCVGRLGAGVAFDGAGARVVLPASGDAAARPASELTVALWVRPETGGPATQVIYGQGDPKQGVSIAIDGGRLVAGLWQDERSAWLDLGPAVTGVWQHVTLAYDGRVGTLRGFVDGVEAASVGSNLPATLAPLVTDAALGGAPGPIRIDAQRVVADEAAYRGAIDEFYRFSRAIGPTEASCLALRLPSLAASDRE